MNHLAVKKPNPNRLVLTALAGIALALAACGGGLVRGQPPLVGISALQLGGGQIQSLVHLHNPNDIEMEVDRVEMSMTLGEADLGQRSNRPAIRIHPNGTEEIRFDFPADDLARRKLAQLESGERNSIPYTIDGRVFDSEGKAEKFSQRGYLYPVPGRPGQFRGAGPQRETPRDW